MFLERNSAQFLLSVIQPLSHIHSVLRSALSQPEGVSPAANSNSSPCHPTPPNPFTSPSPHTQAAAGTHWARPSLELYKDLLNYTDLTAWVETLLLLYGTTLLIHKARWVKWFSALFVPCLCSLLKTRRLSAEIAHQHTKPYSLLRLCLLVFPQLEIASECICTAEADTQCFYMGVVFWTHEYGHVSWGSVISPARFQMYLKNRSVSGGFCWSLGTHFLFDPNPHFLLKEKRERIKVEENV